MDFKKVLDVIKNLNVNVNSDDINLNINEDGLNLNVLSEKGKNKKNQGKRIENSSNKKKDVERITDNDNN